MRFSAVVLVLTGAMVLAGCGSPAGRERSAVAVTENFLTAASAGDGAAFTAALARADQLARAATTRLDGD